MAKNGVKRHKKNRRAKRAERWTGQGGRAAAPFLLLILLLGSLRWSIIFFSLFSPTAESGPRLLSWDNTPERRSRFVTLPWKQNFWITTTRKRHLKNEFALFQTSSILFNFIQFVKCWRNYPGVNPKGPYVSFKKKLFVSHLRHKAGAWN